MPFWFWDVTLLRSCMHSPGQDCTQKFVLLVQSGEAANIPDSQPEFSFLHLTLLRDGTISMEVSNSRRLEFSIFSFRPRLCHGVTRAISRVGSEFIPTKVYGYTLTTDPDQRDSISFSELPGLADTRPVVFDGIKGRLCSTNRTELTSMYMFMFSHRQISQVDKMVDRYD